MIVGNPKKRGIITVRHASCQNIKYLELKYGEQELKRLWDCQVRVGDTSASPESDM